MAINSNLMSLAHTPQLLRSRQVVKERNSCVVLNKNPLLFRTSRRFILCAFLAGCGLGWMETGFDFNLLMVIARRCYKKPRRKQAKHHHTYASTFNSIVATRNPFALHGLECTQVFYLVGVWPSMTKPLRFSPNYKSNYL